MVYLLVACIFLRAFWERRVDGGKVVYVAAARRHLVFGIQKLTYSQKYPLLCLRACGFDVSARLVLAGFRGWRSTHMGYRRGKGDAVAEAPHEAGVQPLVPPERAHAPHSILRRVGSALGALTVFCC